MKQKLIYLSLLFMLILSACGDKDEPIDGPAGSPRDWTYEKSQIEFYIDGVEQTSVSEITVSSLQLAPGTAIDVFPIYLTTLKVKGLLPKNKVFTIKVDADVMRFEGTTVYNETTYNVTGEYTGDPFEHYKSMGIKVYLEKQ